MIDSNGVQWGCQKFGNTNKNGYHYINAGFWESCFQKFYFGIDAIAHDTTKESFQNYFAQYNIDAFDTNSINALVAVTLAAQKGNVLLLEKLVERIGTQILNTCSKNYLTPLHHVVLKTNTHFSNYNMNELCIGVKALIRLGANPNIPCFDCHTPLSLSARKIKNIPLAKILIQNNAKMMPCISHAYKTDESGQLTSHEPTMKMNIQVAKLMLAVDISVLLAVGNLAEGSSLSMLTMDVINEITLSIFNSFGN